MPCTIKLKNISLSHFNTKQQAFSLLEFICTIAIFSIIMLTAQHELSHLRSKLIFHSFFNQLSNKIKQLQSRAQHENKEQTIEVLTNEFRFSNKTTQDKLKFPKDVSITQPPSVPKSYSFYSSNVNQAFSLTLENKYTRCSAIISLRGRVRKTCAEL